MSVNEELREIPHNVSAHEATLLVLQESKKGILISPVHINLRKQWEDLGALCLGKLLDLSVAAWLLSTELVAREGQNHEATGAILHTQLAQVLVVSVGEASFARDVHNQSNLSLVLTQLYAFTVNVLDGEVR